MTRDEMNRSAKGGEQEKELLGWLKEFVTQLQLAWKLLWDSRVPLTTKLVPLAVLAYLIMPFDVLPDAILGLGQVDDIVVLLVGLRMFVSLCPPAVVAEHDRLRAAGAGGEGWEVDEEEIIDIEVEMPPEGKG